MGNIMKKYQDDYGQQEEVFQEAESEISRAKKKLPDDLAKDFQDIWDALLNKSDKKAIAAMGVIVDVVQGADTLKPAVLKFKLDKAKKSLGIK